MTKEFGQLLERYLKGSGMTQRQLEQNLGLWDDYVSNAIKGMVNPSAERAVALAGGLDVPEENRAEFLLMAAGHSREEVSRALETSESVGVTSGELRPGEALEIRYTDSGIRVEKLRSER